MRAVHFFKYVLELSLLMIVGYLLFLKQFICSDKNDEVFTNVSFKMQHCDCVRTLITLHASEDISGDIEFAETTCGMDAYRRGGGQYVVSFSFYGGPVVRGYFVGIKENLEEMSRYYPGWVMRLYFEIDNDNFMKETICELACNNTNLDICDARVLPGTPMKDASKVFPRNWRFFPIIDPQVQVFVSRDLDSMFSDRELAAVHEWLESDKDFHFMRDHPQHSQCILAGMWGTKLNNASIRNQIKINWESGLNDTVFWADRKEQNSDQIFLERYFCPWTKPYSISHDSYLCEVYENTKPFPTERTDEPFNYIGQLSGDRIALQEVCPEKCRPKEHLDWIYC